MKGKYQRKQKGEDTSQKTNGSSVNAGVKQEHTGEEDAKTETQKCENSMSSVSKWWHDPAHVIQSVGIFIGLVVALIYACQLRQMIKSNEISRESLQSTQRADITFESITNRRGGNGPHGWKLGIRFENSGNTESVRTINDPHIKALPSEPDDELFKISNTDKFTEMPIGPKRPAFIEFDWLLEKDLFGEDFSSKDPTVMDLVGKEVHDPQGNKFYVWGWVVYNDVFKGTKPHLTEFCQQLTSIVPAPDGHGGIGFQACRHHNCTDQYCSNYQAIVDSVANIK